MLETLGGTLLVWRKQLQRMGSSAEFGGEWTIQECGGGAACCGAARERKLGHPGRVWTVVKQKGVLRYAG